MKPAARFVEVRTANAAEVRAAHAAAIALRPTVEADEVDPTGWRLFVNFKRDGEDFCFVGRMFRAPTATTAESRATAQLRRLLGETARAAYKFSPEFIAARTRLEAKIEAVWNSSNPEATDLLKPGPVKVDWARREPVLHILRFTNIATVEARYSPELELFAAAARQEALSP